MAGEGNLEMVRRHIREGETHIARQREIVAQWARAGRDIDTPETVLAQFESIQDVHLAHLARIIAGRP